MHSACSAESGHNVENIQFTWSARLVRLLKKREMQRVRASFSPSVSMNASGLVTMTMCINRIADTRNWGTERTHRERQQNEFIYQIR